MNVFAHVTVLGWISNACAAIAIAGSLYLILALVQTLRFGSKTAHPPDRAQDGAREFSAAVTILKPLRGPDPELYENLRSFCDQDYKNVQVIFGVSDADDLAVPVVQRIIADLPGKDLQLVIDPRVRAVNRKVANLMNMLEHAKHDVLVIADADMRVRPDYLRSILAPLSEHRTGVVTTLFGANAVAGLASQLRAMLTNDQFIPSVLVALTFAKPTFGFGSTLAFARATLERIGGLEALGGHLAEDTALTKRVVGLGLDVSLPPYVVHTIVADDARALWEHEVRWARTIRALQPAGFAGALITYPLPFAVLCALLPGYAWLGISLVAIVLALRMSLHFAARRALQFGGRATPWLIPLRDCLSVASWCAGFFSRDVRWRGQDFRIRNGDELVSEDAHGVRKKPPMA